ncbi:MAG TPA: N-6 DNA methylase [Chitinophagales bacterium]|nr:N-6 DNA methylase [Chitinophagales bacterium]
MFEQTFKNIDDILYKDSGADSELDYIEQTSWILFLRYLDDLERDKADEAALQGKPYNPIIDKEYRWAAWAMPKTADGKPDHQKAMTGPDLVQFVDMKLFPYLAGFKHKNVDSPQTIEYKIGEIFSELKNKIKSGYNLREILEYADELPFRNTKDKHELSHLYESKIKNMGNAGRNGGQYYTPRPLIRAIIEVVQPKIGERIYDGACGSCGFLCETFEYLTSDREKLSTNDLKTLQEKTFYGKEKKNLAYIIGVMNMILHGIEAPNIIHTNTLSENIRDIQEKDRYNVVLANPPFGGNERKEVQQNFDIKSGETAFLFLQHFIKNLKASGRAGIVIKNTFLSNSDNASVSLRKYLLESCDLHTILDMPVGTFTGVGQKTVVLFFTKGEPTKTIWCYQLDVGRSLGKTSPINDNDMVEFSKLQKTFSLGDKSWNINISEINTVNYDLTLRNPNAEEKAIIGSPQEILTGLEKINNESVEILNSKLFQNQINALLFEDSEKWEKSTLGKCCDFFNGKAHEKVIDKAGDYIVVNSKFISTEGAVYKRTAEQLFPLFIGDVVMVMSDVPNGKALAKCYLIDEDDKYTLNQRICAIRSTRFEKKFLYYQLNRHNYLLDFNNGENQTNLRKEDILNTPLFIPSLNEQKEIIEKLDSLIEMTNQVIYKQQKKLDGLEELKKSIFQNVFNSELTKTQTEIPV